MLVWCGDGEEEERGYVGQSESEELGEGLQMRSATNQPQLCECECEHEVAFYGILANSLKHSLYHDISTWSYRDGFRTTPL